MKLLLKKTAIPIILLGTILTSVILLQNVNGWSVIELKTIQYGSYTWTYYTFNIRDYVYNIRDAVLYKKIGFDAIIPEMPKIPPIPEWTDILGGLKYIVNCLIFEVNILIYLINFTILLPTKMLLYPLNIIITLLGINTTNIQWITILRNIMTANVDFVKYWS